MSRFGFALSAAEVAAAADALYQAELQRVQVRPTSALYPHMTLDDAYRIQQAVIDRKLAGGRHVIGRKIGLTSKAMQRAMHIDEPDYGTLLDDMVFADGAAVEVARFTDPRIEVELAFVLKAPLGGRGQALRAPGGTGLGPGLDVEDVLRATREVVPALEIIAARSFRVDPETGSPRGLLDTVADNAASAGVVLGRGARPDDVDLRWCGAVLERNGEVEETGLAAGVLGHPARGVAWLAHRFATHGIDLEPGQLVLAGSFTRPVPIAAGDRFVADYGPLGTIRCDFV